MRGTVTLSEGDVSWAWSAVHDVLLDDGGGKCGSMSCSIAPRMNNWFGVRLCSLDTGWLFHDSTNDLSVVLMRGRNIKCKHNKSTSFRASSFPSSSNFLKVS